MADFISCVDKEFLDEKEGKDAGAKRRDYLHWDDYFMGIALLSAQRSKDPSTQVGACIVDESNKIVGIGYNGFPRGCSDDELSWARKAADVKETKYPYVVHAEVNAILNSTVKLNNAKMYVALFPCNECAKMIIQAGIKEIVYLSDKYSETDSVKAARRMFKMAGVATRKLETKVKKLEVNFSV
jgi:dCMP deaminase